MIKIIDLTQDEIDELGLKDTPICKLVPKKIMKTKGFDLINEKRKIDRCRGEE